MCLSTPYPNTASLWTISVSAHVCLYARMCVCVCFVTREVLTSHTHQEWREEEQNSFHGNCWHRVIKREGERERKNDNKKYSERSVLLLHSTYINDQPGTWTATITMNTYSLYIYDTDYDHTSTHTVSGVWKWESHHTVPALSKPLEFNWCKRPTDIFFILHNDPCSEPAYTFSFPCRDYSFIPVDTTQPWPIFM